MKRYMKAASLAVIALALLGACGRNADDRTETERAEAVRAAAPAAADPYVAPEPEAPDTAADLQAELTEETVIDPATDDAAGTPAAMAIAPRQTISALAAAATRDDITRITRELFRAADANADGKVDRAEYLVLSAAEAVSGAAVTAGETGVRPAPSTPTAPSPHTDPVAAGTTPDAATAGELKIFPFADGDGLASEGEMSTWFLAKFEEADANKDGRLNDAEKTAFTTLVGA